MRNLEQKREKHIQKYGSMLFCPERETLCFYMDGMWATGCERDGCILDDPEYQKQQEVIRKNQKKAAEEAKRNAEEEKRERFIADKMKEIHRIEEMSREAYRRNRPKRGDELFEKARSMKIELKRQTSQ